MASFLRPLLTGAVGRASIVNERTGGVVVAEVETAFDSKTRNRGLLGRSGLPESVGLVIAPTNAVHTFFMRFPIDVVFVDRAGVVRRVVANLRPWRISASLRAYAVLETAAGVIARSGTVAGDRLMVTTPPSGSAEPAVQR